MSKRRLLDTVFHKCIWPQKPFSLSLWSFTELLPKQLAWNSEKYQEKESVTLPIEIRPNLSELGQMRNPVRNSYFDCLTAIRFLKLTTDAAVVKLRVQQTKTPVAFSKVSKVYSECKMRRPRSFLIDAHRPAWGQTPPSVWSIPINPGWRWEGRVETGEPLAGGLTYEADLRSHEEGEESSTWTGRLILSSWAFLTLVFIPSHWSFLPF